MDPEDIADQSVEGGDSSDQRWAEHLTHRDSDSIVAIAPHGGQMEPYTDAQPFHLSTSLSDCSAWTFCGYTEEGSARDVYYTTSTAIEPSEYELLSGLLRQQFDLAIAFHGYAPDREHPEVYVGGTLPAGDRTKVASAIETETGLESTSARPGDGLNAEYGGTAADNILNRLAEDSLQLEQTLAARKNHATVCEGVVTSLESVRTE